MLFTLAQAHALLPGSTLVGRADTPVERVHTDTRSMRAGDLFVALRGERYDGHDHLIAAKAAGAVAALAAHGIAEAGLSGLQVTDTQAALTTLATAWRARHSLPLIAVTGSNGKTTVTQMLAAILRAGHGEAALATAGNLNNHIGVPLTVLRLRGEGALRHRCAVVELGMNHPGEIAELARVAQPTVALVNNAQREHQEFMHTVEAVARENGQAIEALGADGVAVFPADDAHTPLWRDLAGARRSLTFTLDGSVQADVAGTAVWDHGHWALRARTPLGVLDLRLGVAGRHNARNALAAVAAAIAAGESALSITAGLAAFRPVKGRGEVHALEVPSVHGAPSATLVTTLVDDTYNANPDSMRAAIDLLAELPAPQALLLGDMGEVGDRGPQFHAEVGAHARDRGIAVLWAAGEASVHAVQAYGDGGGGHHFDSVEALVAALPGLPSSASVLVKGSRFMRMERVVQALRASAPEAG